MARIELPAAGLRKALSAPVRVKILQGLRAIGFTYIAIDIEGYVAGSMNLGLEQKSVTTS